MTHRSGRPGVPLFWRSPGPHLGRSWRLVQTGPQKRPISQAALEAAAWVKIGRDPRPGGSVLARRSPADPKSVGLDLYSGVPGVVLFFIADRLRHREIRSVLDARPGGRRLPAVEEPLPVRTHGPLRRPLGGSASPWKRPTRPRRRKNTGKGFSSASDGSSQWPDLRRGHRAGARRRISSAAAPVRVFS